ncbi:MAG: hypothetical protein RKP73_08740 [Candidatus Contendobacter sp.]|nr:hypothetical protein [Candidatus Contendobacter sp.]
MSKYKKVWFVYHLPDFPIDRSDSLESSLVGTEEHQKFFAIWFAPYLKWYKETGDPLYMLDLFRMCHENRIYPPTEVMDWIGDALIKFINSEGHEDIADLLGLKSPGPGKKNPLQNRNKKSLAYLHESVMHMLLYFFPITITAAAEGLYERETVAGRPVPDVSWLEEQYRKKWKKRFDENDPSITIHKEKPDELSKFLASFTKSWRTRYGLK